MLSTIMVTRARERIDMPYINVEIVKAWRHTGEVNRIHYTVRRVGGGVRHLVVDEGHALYGVLEEHLTTQGYAGPRLAHA